MKIGYARVSTKDQNLDLQIDALTKYECDEIFQEKISSGKERPELLKVLKYLRTGDIFVVWRMDRIGRSLVELLNIINDLNKRNISFVSIMDNIDTTSSMGKFQLSIFGAFSEYEKNLISERTKAGLEAAKKKGVVGGRPKGLTEEIMKKAKLVEKLYSLGDLTIVEVCKNQKISRATFYRYLKICEELNNEEIKPKPTN